MLFFAKKKFYFDVENHKVEVYADAKNATLVIDGKLYKKLTVYHRGDNASCQFKIKGKILSVTLKTGNYLPDVSITVDGVIPKFTKIKQHSFLKSGINKKEKQA
ncbi:MAG: hypothetical protein IJY90_02035 [Clostridia bacterium]|nr:hypothetical protein [Clostridia bacterium]